MKAWQWVCRLACCAFGHRWRVAQETDARMVRYCRRCFLHQIGKR